MLDETDREARITLIERATVVLYFLVAVTGFSLLAALDPRFLLGALSRMSDLRFSMSGGTRKASITPDI